MMRWLLISLLAVVGPVWADDTPIPRLAEWEANMTTYAKQHCAKLAPGAADWGTQADIVYYDGERVYYQIAAYTKDPTWQDCAQRAEAVYRDGYVIPNKGGVAGWNNFTHGMVLDYQQTGDPVSRDTVVSLAEHASFAADGTPLSFTADAYYSREVAYVIMAYLNAEAIGQPRRARLADMITQALDHIDQWFGRKSASFVRPFMVGITLQALIEAYAATGDPCIPPAIKTALDGLWPLWDAMSQSFLYTNVDTGTLPSNAPGYNSGGRQPAPDLNLLIAPAFAWWYARTGDITYRERGDQIFAGGVNNAKNWLYQGKQFDQNYWWSPFYIVWRKAATPGVALQRIPMSLISKTPAGSTPASAAAGRP